MSILDLFCSVDEFWQRFEPLWERELLASGQRRRRRATRLHPSELMTILILFQQSQYRTFKAFYTQHVQRYWRGEFPQLVSYTRFVELMPRCWCRSPSICTRNSGHCTGVSFIDSTALAVCHHARIQQHRVFRPRCRAGQDLGRLVLRLQAAPGRQRPRRVAGLLPHPRQRRRPPSRPASGPAPLRQTLRRQGLHLRSRSPKSCSCARDCA